MLSIDRLNEKVKAKFWSNVQKSCGCWEWQGYCDKCGYGRLRAGDKRLVGVHRLSWEMHFGIIPEGMCVCHHCDNPKCVRPEHLFVGTHDDNMADMVRKKRCHCGDSHYFHRHPEKIPDRSGTKNGRSKLTEKDVREIRSLSHLKRLELARRYGVSQAAISFVILRETWKDVS